MNSLQIYSSELASLGITLFHSIWQGFILFLVYKAVTGALPRLSPSFKHHFLVVLIIVQLVWSVISYTQAFANYEFLSGAEGPLTMEVNLAALQANWNESFSLTSMLGLVMPYWLVIWFTGFLIFFVRLNAGLVYLHQLNKSAKSQPESEWSVVFEKLKERLNLSDRVSLKFSYRIDSPMVTGVLKSVILIPGSMLTGLTPWQMEAVILHELAHIKRKDFLVNIMQHLVEAIYFFNPFIWHLSNQLRDERELCCDYYVTTQGYSPSQYARILLLIEELRLKPLVFSLNFNGTQNKFKDRIINIMGKSKNSSKGGPLLTLLALLVCMTFISWTASNKESVNDETVNESVLTEATDILPDTTRKERRQMKKAEKVKPSKQSPKEVEKVKTPEKPMHLEEEMRELERILAEKQQKINEISLIAVNESMREIARQMAEVNALAAEMSTKSTEASLKLIRSEAFQKEIQLLKELESVNKKAAAEKRADIERIMREMEMPEFEEFTEMSSKIEKILNSEEHQRKMRELELKMEELEFKLDDFDMNFDLDLDGLETTMRELEVNMAEFEEKMVEFERRVEKFRKNVVPILIEDGYLENKEDLKSFQIEDGKLLKVNGKKISSEHQSKYDKVIKECFEGDISIKINHH